MRLDVEFVLCNGFVAFFNATLDASRLADCPPVSFTDSMAWDEAHRIVVFAPAMSNYPENPGAFEVDVQVMVKSQWTQPNSTEDMVNHFDRVNDVRNALLASDLAERVAAVTDATKLGITYVNKAMQFTTNIDTENGWVTSETQMKVQCYLPDPA